MNIKGGFDCEIVERPEDITQSECPICKQILRDPYQVKCCGYAFCRVCIETVRRSCKPCPCCEAKRIATFEDKRLKRSLNQFKVTCLNKEQGCKWVGELGQLDNHLNMYPSQQNQLQGCQYSRIKCLHCSELFLRPDIEDHQGQKCHRRPFSCEYCKTFKSTCEKLTANHWPVCRSYPMPCTNKCGETLQRQNLENHIANDCPLTIINCDFQHVGCEVRLPRKDMPAHLKESVALHLSRNTEYSKQIKAELLRVEREKNTELATQMQRLNKLETKQITETVKLKADQANLQERINEMEWNQLSQLTKISQLQEEVKRKQKYFLITIILLSILFMLILLLSQSQFSLYYA